MKNNALLSKVIFAEHLIYKNLKLFIKLKLSKVYIIEIGSCLKIVNNLENYLIQTTKISAEKLFEISDETAEIKKGS
ncbi:MAG: hypothetical protein H6613_09145 [Ignavibacteriales bacterium]|nr:hypothetical protein [Ignavibacteriales bacterium]